MKTNPNWQTDSAIRQAIVRARARQAASQPDAADAGDDYYGPMRDPRVDQAAGWLLVIAIILFAIFAAGCLALIVIQCFRRFIFQHS